MNDSGFMLDEAQVCASIANEVNVKITGDGIEQLVCDGSFFSRFSSSGKCDDTYSVSVNVNCSDDAKLIGDRSVCVDIPISKKIIGILSRRMDSLYWSRPEFNTDLTKNLYGIQDMIIKFDNSYIAVVAINNESFTSCIGPSGCKENIRFYLSLCYEGECKLNGTFAVIAKGDNPYEALRKAYRFSYEKGYIKTPPRSQKRLPEMYRKLGWCTWDAFYKQVCAEGILKKLEEFKEKGVPIKWVLIDDGWSQLAGRNFTELKSFYEDKLKFPDGLKKCIETMKNRYGVEYVGVWHAFNGCWNGINFGSELFKSQENNLVKVNNDWYIPKADKYFDFFDEWYAYLKSQGVDFVKVDAQGMTAEKLKGNKHYSGDYIKMHLGLERAAEKYFDSNVINCMGMSNMDMHFRPSTFLARNSDDFYPNRANGFAIHAVTNAYNAVFQRELFFCDFDMWWTNHISAKQNSVLRAISGGPIYISDKVGETVPEYIIPLIDDDGNVIMCDNIAVPTDDCLFRDCSNDVLKIYNTVGVEGVVAAFNLSNETKNIEVSKIDFNGEGDFAAYSYFERKWYTDTVRFSLEPHEVEIVNFYQKDNSCVRIGNLEKYISIATGREKIIKI